MSKIFSPKAASVPAPVTPAPAAPPPTIDTAKDSAAAAQSVATADQQSQDEVNRRRGRAATVLTSQQGDTSRPTLGAATALGY